MAGRPVLPSCHMAGGGRGVLAVRLAVHWSTSILWKTKKTKTIKHGGIENKTYQESLAHPLALT